MSKNILREQLVEAYNEQQKAWNAFINGLDTNKLDQGEMARLMTLVKANSNFIATFEISRADAFRLVSAANDWGYLGGDLETEVPNKGIV